MLAKTRGVVLHSVKYSESSLILKVYTEMFGLQSYIVNGVRSSRGKSKAAFFSPLSILELEVYKRENKSLHRIKEFRLEYSFQSLGFDIIKGSIGLFIAELLKSVIHEEERNDRLYHFIEDSIISLDREKTEISSFHLKFLIELTSHLGFYPSGNYSEKCQYFNLVEGEFVSEIPDHPNFFGTPLSRVFSELIKGNTNTFKNKSDRNHLLEQLLNYYSQHVSNFTKVKSHKVLHEVLAMT